MCFRVCSGVSVVDCLEEVLLVPMIADVLLRKARAREHFKQSLLTHPKMPAREL